jgi:hypothetical protein
MFIADKFVRKALWYESHKNRPLKVHHFMSLFSTIHASKPVLCLFFCAILYRARAYSLTYALEVYLNFLKTKLGQNIWFLCLAVAGANPLQLFTLLGSANRSLKCQFCFSKKSHAFKPHVVPYCDHI